MKQVLMQTLLGGLRTRATVNLLNCHPPRLHNFAINNSSIIEKNVSSNYVVPRWPSSSFYSSLSAGSKSAGNGELPAGLVRESLPKHATMILDGNRRWCKSKGIPLTYMPFFDAMTNTAKLCAKWGIPYSSHFVFTTENWVRTKEWHDIFFGDCQVYLQNNLEIFMRNEFRVSIIGEISRIPKSLQEVIKHVQEATIDHTKHDLMFAINYGGRRDITQATRKISEKIKANLVDPQDINEDLIEKELWTNISGRVMPDPDLVIRVGGQLRLSNYLLWQMAYSELYFIDINAPDFGEEELIKALLSFQNRKRNFGS